MTLSNKYCNLSVPNPNLWSFSYGLYVSIRSVSESVNQWISSTLQISEYFGESLNQWVSESVNRFSHYDWDLLLCHSESEWINESFCHNWDSLFRRSTAQWVIESMNLLFMTHSCVIQNLVVMICTLLKY